jgi:hypothetical protein
VLLTATLRASPLYPGNDRFSGFLYPAQPGAIKSQSQEKQRFTFDSEYYRLNQKRISDTVSVQYEGEVRGDRLSTISVVPAHYNPIDNSIQIIISMEIEIEFTSAVKSLSAGGRREFLWSVATKRD